MRGEGVLLLVSLPAYASEWSLTLWLQSMVSTVLTLSSILSRQMVQ